MIPKPSVSRRRLWLMRFAAMLFIPLLILSGIELGLRLAGYGYDTSFFRRITMDGRDYYVPNENFSYRFFPPAIARRTLPFRFAAQKSTNSYRIFLFGESAAMGDPEPTYGVGRYLEVLLRERYPGTDFQVICVALTAIDSNAILPIARECARHQGDLWLIYMGNNEMVGPFGAETSYGFHAPGRGMIRLILAIKATRIGQLLDAAIRRLNSSTPKKWRGMEMFVNNRLGYNDPARLRAYKNFTGNLQDILVTAHQAGVPVILSTVAVNLKDCAPFASVHSAGLDEKHMSAWNESYEQGIKLDDAGSYGEALALYQKAAGIDPQFADLEFRMGNCDLALTNDDRSRRDFELARDYDALDFRADARINSIIREAESSHAGQGVNLLDAAEIMAQRSPAGIPGYNLFYEHVHLNFAGNYLLALEFAEKIKRLLPDSITVRDQGNWVSAEHCDDALAITARDRQGVWLRILSTATEPPFTGQLNHADSLKFYETKLDQIKSMMNAQTPRQGIQLYEQALASAPDDIFLHLNFVAFLEAEEYYTRAATEAKRCCELLPQVPDIYYHTAVLLVRGGKRVEAVQYLARAIALRRNYVEAMNEMGEILANQQNTGQAVDWFKRAVRADPGYVETYINLGFLEQIQGEPDAAMASYQRAAALEPDGPADYFNRANLAASAYRWDEVITCLSWAVNARPPFWQARYQLGIQLAAKGEFEEAQKQFSEVIRYRPDFVQAHSDLGTALAAQGKTNEALAEFRAVLQLHPEDSLAQQQIQLIEANPQKVHAN
jgi:tetratricopeptide (TPR) repeat protein